MSNDRSATSVAQAFLNQRMAHIEGVLPPGMKGQGERLIKRALLTMSKKKELMECTAESFFQCVLAAAELGLAIDGRLAHAVPYGKVAQFQMDYKGMVAVARRTKIIKNAFARLVYQDDHFEQDLTDGIFHFTHKPGAVRDTIIGAYSVVVQNDGYFEMDWMLVHELEAIRARSKAAKGFSPWTTDLGEMYKKTVLKRLLKTYMDSDYLVSAYIADEDDEVIEGTATETQDAPLPTGRVNSKAIASAKPMPANFTSPAKAKEPVKPAAPAKVAPLKQPAPPPPVEPEPEPEPQVEQTEPIVDEVLPEWVNATIAEIKATKLMSAAEAVGDRLLAEFRGNDVAEPDKVEFYPILFSIWAEHITPMVKQSDRPRFEKKVNGWQQYLGSVHQEVMSHINSF